MPNIKTIRVLRFLWVGWKENDNGERGPIRYGWSENYTRKRVLRMEW